VREWHSERVPDNLGRQSQRDPTRPQACVEVAAPAGQDLLVWQPGSDAVLCHAQLFPRQNSHSSVGGGDATGGWRRGQTDAQALARWGRVLAHGRYNRCAEEFAGQVLQGV